MNKGFADFYTADTHFGSERTLKFSKRPFKSVKEMDETIIKNWNEVVSKDDVVYHLGDFGNFDVLDRLNGYIILILGNYEFDRENLKYVNGFHANIAEKFNNTVLYNRVIPLILNGKECLVNMCHRPQDCNKEMFNLFGHIHKLCMIKPYGLNVGVDCHNFYPCSIKDIEFYKYAIDNCYDKNVFE
jgi:calcineurin-like phosphoesterase family protein